MSDLIATLRAASVQKAEETLQPTLSRIGRLRESLDSFEKEAREEAVRNISNGALRALGLPEESSQATVPQARRQLRTALEDLLSFVGLDSLAPVEPPSRSPEPVVVEAPRAPLPPLRPEPGVIVLQPPSPEPVEPALDIVLPPKPPKVVQVSQAMVDRARGLIREVETMASDPNLSSQHHIRLLHLFQAQVAECRMLMQDLPSNHPLQDELGNRVIRTITRLKTATSVEPFIKGLAFGSSENWYRIGVDSRKKVRKFDQDTELPISEPRKPKSSPTSSKTPEPPKTSYTWPTLPYLRKCMKDTSWPLLIVGGSKRDQAKLDSVQERYGIECEWVEFSSTNARVWDSIADRIVAGKIAGAILVEGFMSHKAYRRLMKAADKNPGVPIAMAGKGGISALGDAINDIERQIGIAVCQIPDISAEKPSMGSPE